MVAPPPALDVNDADSLSLATKDAMGVVRVDADGGRAQVALLPLCPARPASLSRPAREAT